MPERRSEPVAPATIRAGAVEFPPRARVRIEAGGRSWAGRVLSRTGLRLELGLAPAPETEPPGTGGEVELLLRGEGAAWLGRASVLDRSPERLVLRLDDAPLQRVQRREFFRMRVRYACSIDLGPSDTAGAPVSAGMRSRGGRSRLFRVIDLSAGGFCCLDRARDLEIGTVHAARLKLPGLAAPLPVTVEVVRRTRARGESAAGLRFVNCRERIRERILRALFSEYRSRRSAVLG